MNVFNIARILWDYLSGAKIGKRGYSVTDYHCDPTVLDMSKSNTDMSREKCTSVHGVPNISHDNIYISVIYTREGYR